MSEKLISALHILPGPTFSIKERFSKKYQALSVFSEGTVVSIGDKDTLTEIAGYKFVLVGVGLNYGFKSDCRLFLKCLSEALKLRKKSKLDLIVCYDPLKTGVMGYILKLLFRCKLVIEVNGVYQSKVLYKDEGGNKKIFKRKLYQFILRNVLSRADGIKGLFSGQLGELAPSNRAYVDYFFDYTQIDSVPYKNSGSKLILSMGYPKYIKGHDLLIAAFKQVADKYPGWTLAIVGNYIEKDIQDLKQLAADERIKIERPVDFSEVPALIDSCEIFALPSRSEAMGRVLLETMARSKVRLGSRVEGIPMVINNNKDGLLCNPEDINDLAEKLAQLMSSEAERKRLAEAGLERFEKEFTVDAYGPRVKLLYEAALSK